MSFSVSRSSFLLISLWACFFYLSNFLEDPFKFGFVGYWFDAWIVPTTAGDFDDLLDVSRDAELCIYDLFAEDFVRHRASWILFFKILDDVVNWDFCVEDVGISGKDGEPLVGSGG